MSEEDGDGVSLRAGESGEDLRENRTREPAAEPPMLSRGRDDSRECRRTQPNRRVRPFTDERQTEGCDCGRWRRGGGPGEESIHTTRARARARRDVERVEVRGRQRGSIYRNVDNLEEGNPVVWLSARVFASVMTTMVVVRSRRRGEEGLLDLARGGDEREETDARPVRTAGVANLGAAITIPRVRGRIGIRRRTQV